MGDRGGPTIATVILLGLLSVACGGKSEHGVNTPSVGPSCTSTLQPLPGQTTQTIRVNTTLSPGNPNNHVGVAPTNVSGLWVAEVAWQSSDALVAIDAARVDPSQPGGFGSVVALGSQLSATLSRVCWEGARDQGYVLRVTLTRGGTQDVAVTVMFPRV